LTFCFRLGRDSYFTTVFRVVAYATLKSIPQGAATTVYVATSPDVEDKGGQYFEDCGVGKPNNKQFNDTIAAKLWEVSEKRSGVSFPALQ